MSAPCRTSKGKAEAGGRPGVGSGSRLLGALAGLLLLTSCVPRQRVTFVGDSITASGPWQEAYPHLQVSNQGVPGNQAADVLARLDQVTATRAHLYLLMVGINDLRSGQPPGRVAALIGEIRQRLLKSASPPPRVVVLATLPCRPVPVAQPINGCTANVRAGVEQLNHSLRQQTPKGEFLDLTPTLGPQGVLEADFSLDGIHLTDAGYKRWQERLTPWLKGR